MAEMMNAITNSIGRVGGTSTTDTAKRPESNSGPSFKDTLGTIKPGLDTGPAAPNGAAALRFSNHAVERMRLRGISYSQEMLGKIDAAVAKAAAKGARETLLLTDDSALIVSVNNRTVVTVMDKNALKENVFTNIDSTVVL